MEPSNTIVTITPATAMESDAVGTHLDSNSNHKNDSSLSSRQARVKPSLPKFAKLNRSSSLNEDSTTTHPHQQLRSGGKRGNKRMSNTTGGDRVHGGVSRTIDPAIFSVLKVDFSSKYGIRAKNAKNAASIREDEDEENDDRASSLSPACSFRSERGFSSKSSILDNRSGGSTKSDSLHRPRRRQVSDPFSQSLNFLVSRQNDDDDDDQAMETVSNVSSRASSREFMLQDLETSSTGGLRSTCHSRSASDAGISLPVFQLKMLTQRLQGGSVGNDAEAASPPSSPRASLNSSAEGAAVVTTAATSTLVRVPSLKTPSPSPLRGARRSTASASPGGESLRSGVEGGENCVTKRHKTGSSESLASLLSSGDRSSKTIISVSSVPFIRTFKPPEAASPDKPQQNPKQQQQRRPRTGSPSPSVQSKSQEPRSDHQPGEKLVKKHRPKTSTPLKGDEDLSGDVVIERQNDDVVLGVFNVVTAATVAGGTSDVDEGCVDPEDLDSDYDLIENPRLKSPRNVKVKIQSDPTTPHPVILKPKNSKGKRGANATEHAQSTGSGAGGGRAQTNEPQRLEARDSSGQVSKAATEDVAGEVASVDVVRNVASSTNMSRGGSNASIKSDTHLRSALKNSLSSSSSAATADGSVYARPNRSLTHPTKRISTINEEDFGSLDTNGLGSVASIKVEIVPSSPTDLASGYKSEMSSMESNMSGATSSAERINSFVGTPSVPSVSFSKEVEIDSPSSDDQQPPPHSQQRQQQQQQQQPQKLAKRGHTKKRRVVSTAAVDAAPVERVQIIGDGYLPPQVVATIVVEPPPPAIDEDYDASKHNRRRMSENSHSSANSHLSSPNSPRSSPQMHKRSMHPNKLVTVRPALSVATATSTSTTPNGATNGACRSASFSGATLSIPSPDARSESSPTTPTEDFVTTKSSMKPRAQTAPVCSTSLSEANNFTKTHTLPLERKKSTGSGLVSNIRSMLGSSSGSDKLPKRSVDESVGVGSSVSLASTSITGLSSGLSTPSESMVSLLTVASDVSSTPDNFVLPPGSGLASPILQHENRSSPRPTSPIKPIPEASEADEASASTPVVHPAATTPTVVTADSCSITDAEKLELQRQEKEKLRIDKRQFVMRQMYDTEKSYVECLETLFSNYYTPLKNADVIDDGIVTDIFYKIPEIKMHHHVLLNSLEHRVKNWDSSQIIGDILQNCFTKESVIETYEAFINNWPKAQDSLKSANQKASFTKFSEHQVKEHRRRLKLDDLIIQPVQRVPRYELFIKDFLKYTPKQHPDFSLLQQAQTVLHSLAQRINEVRSLPARSGSSLSGRGMRGGSDPGLQGVTVVDEKQLTLKDLEDLIEQCSDLVHPNRSYLRHDMVTLSSQVAGTKRDRCIFLFSDLILITGVKRKSGTVHRKPSVTLNSPLGKHFLENNKHKLLLRLPLEDITLVKNGDGSGSPYPHDGHYNHRELSSTGSLHRKAIDHSVLEEDLGILKQMEDLSSMIHVAHPELEDAIFDMVNKIAKQLQMPVNKDGSSSAIFSSSSSFHGQHSSPSVIGDNNNNNAGGGNNNNNAASRLDLRFQYADHAEFWSLIFGNKEKRSAWEETFIEARSKLRGCLIKDGPEFFMALPVPKNRAGMQFSCAASCVKSVAPALTARSAHSHHSNPVPTHPALDYNYEVWVCNSDGCVGQICFLTMSPEPSVSTINTVCSARIKCIAQVPGYDAPGVVLPTAVSAGTHHRPNGVNHGVSDEHLSPPSRSRTVSEPASRHLVDANHPPTRSHSAASGRNADLSLTVEEEDEEMHDIMEHKGLLPDGGSSGNIKKVDNSDDEGIMSDPESNLNGGSSGRLRNAESHNHNRVDGSTGGRDSASRKDESLPDLRATTMWLGTEDGSIHIMHRCLNASNNAARNKKSKIHHAAAVLSIVHLQQRVFVSLATGDLVVYGRTNDGVWDVENPYVRQLGNVSSPITKLLEVNGRLWCGRLNRVVVINPSSLQVEREFQVDADRNRSILCMTRSHAADDKFVAESPLPRGVWISLEHGHEVKLFDGESYDCVAEVSVKQAVTHKLQICDDIIRQHKVACLRITALLALNDRLWIGTSAGIILNLVFPPVARETGKNQHRAGNTGGDNSADLQQRPLLQPVVTGLVQGHTGHVRFLTSIQCPQIVAGNTGVAGSTASSGGAGIPTVGENEVVVGGGTLSRDSPRKKSSTGSTASTGSSLSDGYLSSNAKDLPLRHYVISGGDGFEDFSGNQTNDNSIGRDDSTNHLLLWEV